MSEAMQAETEMVPFDMVKVCYMDAQTGESAQVVVGEAPSDSTLVMYSRDLSLHEPMTREQAEALACHLLATERTELWWTAQ